MNYKITILVVLSLLCISITTIAQSETDDAVFTASEPTDILEALVVFDVIENEGLELYRDETLSLNTSGVEFILGSQSGDVVYGGDITFNLDNENGQCYLLGFANFSAFGSGLNNGILTAVFPGETGNLDLGFADYGGQNRTYAETTFAISDTVQVVVVIVDQIATVYINGIPFITDFEVELRNGIFGAGMETQNEVSNTTCIIDNMFANVLNVDSITSDSDTDYTEVINMPSNLVRYNSSASNILSDLQDANVIPIDGELQTLEGAYIQTSLPVDYVSIAEDYDDNFIWGGTITFNAAENDLSVQLCELGIDSTFYTVTRFGNEVTYAEGGFVVTFYDSGNILYGSTFAGEYTPFQATRFLLVVLDGNVTLYIDGERRTQHSLFRNNEEGEGLAFGVRFPYGGTNCQLSNTWVYDLSDSDLVYLSDQPCIVNVASAVNQRAEPSTTASSPGQLQSGIDMIVIGQTTDDSGFIWWQLEDESWVREDVVNISGGCTDIPITQ